MSNLATATVKNLLFATGPLSAYAVVDPDFCPQIGPMIEQHGVEHAALLGRQVVPDSLRRSPRLVKLEPSSPFSDWLLSGWGRSWGIYAVSRASMDTLREHFRSLLMVLDPAGTLLFFRYYDPRVFGVYLPTVNEQETDAVFGPVDSYLFEEEDTHAILRFSRKKKLLTVDRIDLIAGPAAPHAVSASLPPRRLTTDHGPRTPPRNLASRTSASTIDH